MVKNSSPRTKASLILAGGGIKVAFQAGVLQVWLDEAGLTFDHVDGASGGTFNLAMLCQGMTGSQIAQNWRETSPAAGISVNWRELLRLGSPESLLTLDGYRKNIFTRWGLDWKAIRASDTNATFNVYNFSRQELEVLPPVRMSEDLLVACSTLPMWFPPIHIRGDAYIDAVYVTDANLEEALARGADEIWVIWTVSERGIWNPGFVSTYFQIIEAAANGHFRRVVARIEKNNEAVAAGKRGEFGKHIELKILRAEVPIHYIVEFSADRIHETVNRGVAAARAWCAEQGITLHRKVLPAGSPSPVSLQFTEEMTGYVGVGETDAAAGYAVGRKQGGGRGSTKRDGGGTTKGDGGGISEGGAGVGSPLEVHLTIRTEDVDHFVTDPDHVASLSGQVNCAAFGGVLPVQDGTFNLLVDRGDPTRKEMRYRIHTEDGEGKPITLVGIKTVQSANPLLIWRETTTLYTRILRGQVAPDEDRHAEILAAGIIRITVPAFLRQLRTFRTTGPSTAVRAAGLARFGALFLGKLWDVYAPAVLNPGPLGSLLVGKLLDPPERTLRAVMARPAS